MRLKLPYVSAVALVLLPLPLPPLSYLVPYGQAPGPVGGRVVVPWQGTLRTGVCVGTEPATAAHSMDLKELTGWLDAEPWFAADATGLFLELATAFAVPAGLVLAALAPTGLGTPVRHEVRAPGGARLPGLESGEWLDAERVDPAVLAELLASGVLQQRVTEVQRTVSRLVARGKPEGLTERQQHAFDVLADSGPADSAAALARLAGVGDGVVRTLVKKGHAAYVDVPAPPVEPVLPDRAAPLPTSSLQLPDCGHLVVAGGTRQARLAAVLPLLLRDLEAGLSPMVLSPEVAWLEEAVAALRNHAEVIMLSGQSDDREREAFWERAAGDPVLVAGTYPALLAPVRRPGHLVVLEAASDTWKLQSGARLFIPDAARLLDRKLIETDVIAAVELTRGAEQVIRIPPPVRRLHVTDLNSASGWPLDADLTRVVRQVADRGRQAVVLASRRGFSGALTCQDCGEQPFCPHCDLPLRYHQTGRSLKCHQCGFSRPAPQACESCGGELVPSRAAGTQWLADSLQRMLDGFPVYRYDSDRQDDLAALYRSEPGILVATTAALRLPPLPDAALVAVSHFDAHAASSDFRASESTLRLLCQLPEMSANQRPLILVQSFQPDSPVLAALQQPDQLEAIARLEEETLERRQAFGYPPFAVLARIEVSAPGQVTAEDASVRLAGMLEAAGATAEELAGPVPAPVARVRGRYVQQLLLRTREPGRLTTLLAAVPSGLDRARVRIDVNPRGVTTELE